MPERQRSEADDASSAPTDNGGRSIDPAVVALPPLRWSLHYGPDPTGIGQWVLREMNDGVGSDEVLDVRARPTVTELTACMTLRAGRLVADALAEEALVLLPDALIDDRPGAHN